MINKIMVWILGIFKRKNIPQVKVEEKAKINYVSFTLGKIFTRKKVRNFYAYYWKEKIPPSKKIPPLFV